MLLLHNLADEPVTVDIGPQKDVAVETPREVFADDAYAAPTKTADRAGPEPLRLPVDPAAPRLGGEPDLARSNHHPAWCADPSPSQR